MDSADGLLFHVYYRWGNDRTLTHKVAFRVAASGEPVGVDSQLWSKPRGAGTLTLS